MDVGIIGILFVWLGILFITLWPVLLVSIFLYINRKNISKKWLFSLISVSACYGISFVISIVTAPMLMHSVKTVADGGNPQLFLWSTHIITIAKIITSLFLINLVSKKFKVEEK